ncbi:Periaxin [Harpegnathos saltator]|uniref:Periaxin n=1 Tax=Harpegnathos saltator TaxID=610380 RepID=E2BHQ1_HARSA|nr:Periaxin [Harpegnathos saltator]
MLIYSMSFSQRRFAPKATRVSVVSLRSRDFTGLGFNVCGNMREGIFVKDLLHRGPASESGLIHPGDRISSVKISFRNMVYEDALTILSYASPYDVELEVESGGNGSKPTTLLKKSIGPSSTRICHPLYRSQSIPELSQGHKNVAKRLFMADPNDSVGSNYSTMNSTQKSSKSPVATGQSLERRHDETKNNHHKFGIKVLPALDGTVHRIENQNEHNTNLERRHSRKMDAEKLLVANRQSSSSDTPSDDRKVYSERYQQRDDSASTRITVDSRSVDDLDKSTIGKSASETINIPSEVPAEVHNAAMAARRNRKSYPETLKTSSLESEGGKSPQKNKRKAPAPPKNTVDAAVAPATKKDAMIDTIDSIADYTESLCNYVNKVRDNHAAERQHRLESQSMANRRNSESDTDSEMQNSFTTIELNPADITIHRTPVPEANDDEEDEDDMYRKAASLGDLSKYESKAAATLERAQSLDMTAADTGAKKRKAPLPPEDINESTEDLSRLDQIDTFDRRKLKKSNEWGTLEDVIWSEDSTVSAEADEKAKKTRMRKKSNGTLERSKSAVEIKLKDEVATATVAAERQPDDGGDDDSSEHETSIELYNLPLSKRLTQEFIHAERTFNPDADNSLARIVNDGKVVKSPTLEEMDLDFQLAKDKCGEEVGNGAAESGVSDKSEDFSRALRYFEMHASASPTPPSSVRVSLSRSDDWKEEKTVNDASLYSSRQPVTEEPVSKVTVDRGCRGCHDSCARQSVDCDREKVNGQRRATPTRISSPGGTDASTAKENSDKETERISTPTYLRVHVSSRPEGISRFRSREDSWEENTDSGKNGGAFSTFQAHRTKFEQRTAEQHDRSLTTKSKSPSDGTFDMHFARRVLNIQENESGNRDGNEDDVVEDEDEYEFGGDTGLRTNNRGLFSSKEEDRRNASNVSNVSVSSGENSEDSGLVRESMDYHPRDSGCSPSSSPNAVQKATYITEIKVSSNRESAREVDNENQDATIGGNAISSAVESNGGEPRKSLVQRDVKVTSNGKPTSGKKPPVPPRRSDIAKSPRDERLSDKQVVYVSEYKSANALKGPQILDAQPAEKQPDSAGKKFEHWIFVADKEQGRWSAAAGQSQPVTNIVLSSRDDAK